MTRSGMNPLEAQVNALSYILRSIIPSLINCSPDKRELHELLVALRANADQIPGTMGPYAQSEIDDWLENVRL